MEIPTDWNPIRENKNQSVGTCALLTLISKLIRMSL